MIKTIQDLIIALANYPADSPVIGTWEGVLRCLEVYRSADGVVIVDADYGYDREEYKKKEFKLAVEAYYEHLDRNQ